MRKFLSLVLALVMMMSLVTINAGAKEFTDDGDITYKEAVDVISTIKVMDGYDGGGFQPSGNLTRGAAAKIICNLILGPTTAAELHADTAPYRDVPINHTFAGYIAYCQKEGIVSGYADGSFRPAGTLTGYAFMKMLLGALGYDAEIEGFVGPNWSINVAKKAIGLGLNASLADAFNGVDYITREEAALYAFNTLRTDLVEYDQKITASVNGAEVTVGNSIAKAQEWNNSLTRHNNIRDDKYIQFAEQYFNKLVLTEAEDCFGRPDREWKYDGDEIGTYVNYDLFKQEYTTKVTGKDLRDLLGGSIVDPKDGYTFTITIDGETEESVLSDYGYFTQGNLVRTNTEKVGNTGNGVLTQVFVNNDKEVEHVWIAIINTYLAKATDDYNEKKDEVDFEVWGVKDLAKSGKTPILVKHAGVNGSNTTLTVDGEDFDVKDVKDGDITLVHVAEGEIKEFVEPEVIDETELVAFKKGDWVKAEEQYDYSSAIRYDDEVLDDYDQTNMKDTTYRIFLDEYGYALGIDIVEDADQYVFLAGIDMNSSNLTNKVADGNILRMDGTSETVRINISDSKDSLGDKFSDSSITPITALMNTWCRYTVNANGVYTLTEVAKGASNGDGDQDYYCDGKGVAYKKDDDGNWTKNDKAGQGWDTDVTQFDKSHIFTKSSISGLTRVYANDDTVFMTAELDRLNRAQILDPTLVDDQRAIVISGVDSVAVGARNVSMDVYDDVSDVVASNAAKYAITNNTTTSTNAACNTAYGAYSLFDKNGYVIAVVVVGEDNGSTTNYAFIHSDSANREEYSKSDDVWTWSREAIVNGEVVELLEKKDANPEVVDMVQGEWYEVKYKGDGTVKSATHIDTRDLAGATSNNGKDGKHTNVDGTETNKQDYIFCKDNATHSGAGIYSKFIGNIEDYEAATDYNEGKTVVLWDDMTDGTYTVKVEGSSLQVQTNDQPKKSGFTVAADAKTVLIQDVKPTKHDIKIMDFVETYTGGTSGLKKAIADLEDNDNFVGYIGAIFEGKVATSVVIYDRTETIVDEGESSFIGDIQVEVKNGKVTYKAPAGTDIEDIADAISDELERLGYTDPSITTNGNEIKEVTAKKGSTKYSFDIVAMTGNNAGAGTGSIEDENVSVPETLTGEDTPIIVVQKKDETVTVAQMEAALTKQLLAAGYDKITFNYSADGKTIETVTVQKGSNEAVDVPVVATVVTEEAEVNANPRESYRTAYEKAGLTVNTETNTATLKVAQLNKTLEDEEVTTVAELKESSIQLMITSRDTPSLQGYLWGGIMLKAPVVKKGNVAVKLIGATRNGGDISDNFCNDEGELVDEDPVGTFLYYSAATFTPKEDGSDEELVVSPAKAGNRSWTITWEYADGTKLTETYTLKFVLDNSPLPTEPHE